MRKTPTDVAVKDLVKRLQKPPSFIKRHGDVKIRKLFNRLAEKGSRGLSEQEKKEITPTAQAVKRLNDHLSEYFLTNRTTWHQQERLFVGKSDEGRWVLAKRPLSEIIESDCLKFWFWQCQRLPHDSEKGTLNRSSNKKKEAAIVIAEPLVFYSHNLGGYIRLLDINSDQRLDQQIQHWNDNAREKLRKKLSAIAPVSGAQRLADNIDLEAVRAYIPAGDSNAARRIRRWFRVTDYVKHDVDYEEISDVSPSDFTKTNLIVLASRSSNTLLQQFYTEVPKVRVKLTESGITIDGKDHYDTVDKNGYHRAYVVVTNWTFRSRVAHTYIASNHTRALDRVAELLVSESSSAMEDIVGNLIDRVGNIAQCFQFVFEVELEQGEASANEPALFAESKEPVFFP